MTTSQTTTSAQLVTTPLQNGTLAGTWILDAARSSVSLKTTSVWGLVKINGAFTDLAGQGTVTADGAVSGTVTIGAASIDTNHNKRDAHLRSADFFDAEHHPTIEFALRGVATADGTLVASGELTVRGTSRPLTMPLRATSVGTTPADEAVQLTGELVVDRSEFGLTWNQLGMASMDNQIAVTAVFTRPRAA